MLTVIRYRRIFRLIDTLGMSSPVMMQVDLHGRGALMRLSASRRPRSARSATAVIAASATMSMLERILPPSPLLR